jgi:hypothetical protein
MFLGAWTTISEGILTKKKFLRFLFIVALIKNLYAKLWADFVANKVGSTMVFFLIDVLPLDLKLIF